MREALVSRICRRFVDVVSTMKPELEAPSVRARSNRSAYQMVK
jgi:hypothetical protein